MFFFAALCSVGSVQAQTIAGSSAFMALASLLYRTAVRRTVLGVSKSKTILQKAWA
jgi:nicotinamide mononucleotide (NMN) deamidase PncC